MLHCVYVVKTRPVFNTEGQLGLGAGVGWGDAYMGRVTS
jgi:hypothetical protein